jgi:hypothetical protein
MTQNIEPQNIEVGKTLVHVMSKTVNEKTGKESTSKIHEGIVVSRTSHFLRVFSNAPIEKGGDNSPEVSEMFPITSPKCWCVVVGELKNKFPIPPTLR